MGILLNLNDFCLRGQPIPEQKLSDKKLANADDVFNGLGCLNQADDAGRYSQNGEDRWRRCFTKDASKTGRLSGKHCGGLAVEPIDGSVNEGNALLKSSSVQQIPGGKVVHGIDYQVCIGN